MFNELLLKQKTFFGESLTLTNVLTITIFWFYIKAYLKQKIQQNYKNMT